MDGQTDTQTDRQTYRHTDGRRTDRHTDWFVFCLFVIGLRYWFISQPINQQVRFQTLGRGCYADGSLIIVEVPMCSVAYSRGELVRPPLVYL